MYIRFNPRLSSATMQGTLPGYKHVWCHPYGIANIQSLAHVKEKYPSAITALICGSQTQQEITWSPFFYLDTNVMNSMNSEESCDSEESGMSKSRGAAPGTALNNQHSAAHKTLRSYSKSPNTVQEKAAEIQKNTEAEVKLLVFLIYNFWFTSISFSTKLFTKLILIWFLCAN